MQDTGAWDEICFLIARVDPIDQQIEWIDDPF